MNDIVQAISVCGFPIVSFLICGAFLKYVYDKSLEMLNSALNKLGDLTEAVNHNSEVLRDLVTEVKRINE